MRAHALTALMGAALLASSLPVAAATITYNLTNSDTPQLTTFTSTTFNQTEAVDLNGSGALPAYTLNVGDTISGTVALSDPFTVPAGGLESALLIALNTSTSVSQIAYTTTFKFYDQGLPVAPPVSWQPMTTGSFGLEFGESSFTANPAFTFDAVSFTATITGMVSTNGSAVTSAALDYQGDPFMEGHSESQVSAVPIPAAAWLMLSGLGGLGAMTRKRRAA